MRAFIYLGGGVYESGYIDAPKDGDLILAADSGCENAKKLGLTPHVVVGDFDSFRGTLPEGAETLKVPAEKDFTDSQLAVDVARKKGASEIFLVGGLDGRLDHALSNLSILEALWRAHIRAVISDGKNRVRYIENTSELVLNLGYKYLSVLVADKKARGVRIDGCKYPLKNATLDRTNQFAISNELCGNCALVSVRRGGIYIVESM